MKNGRQDRIAETLTSQVSGSNGSNTSQIAINYLTINHITNVYW